MRQPSRHQVLKAFGVGMAASALPFAHSVRVFAQAPVPTAADGARRLVTLSEASPWSWLTPLGPGDHVAHGWHISSLSGIERGRVVLGLQHPMAGEAAVHLHRRMGVPRGLAHTATLDLLLMNGATGAAPTDESVGLAVLALARRVAHNERAGTVRPDQLAALERHHSRSYLA